LDGWRWSWTGSKKRLLRRICGWKSPGVPRGIEETED